MTGKCNCSCKHCFMDAPEGRMGEMTHAQLKDLIDQLAGAEEATMKAFELCRKKGFLSHAQFTMHHGNVDTIRDTVNALAKVGVRSVKINSVSNMGEWSRQDKGKELLLTPKEAYDAYLAYIPLYYEDGAPIDLQLEGAFSSPKGGHSYSIPMKPDLTKPMSKDSIMNRSMYSSMRKIGCIDPQGRIVPCMSLAYSGIAEKYPNLFETRLSDILSDSTYFRDTNCTVGDFVSHNPKCGDCEHLDACSSGCRGTALEGNETDFFAIDQRTCQFLKEGYYERFREIAERCKLPEREPKKFAKINYMRKKSSG